MLEIDLTTFDLTSLPTTEDEEYEFKSSLTPKDEMGKKLSCAVSGFANSGGGCFVVGIDSNGNADGGLALQVGRQGLREWADQHIHKVSPTPKYEIKLIDDAAGRGFIKEDHAVLLVLIKESYVGPHMASDKRYYLRAGAHTVPATHFIVEAIWAKRHFSKPRLTHFLRQKPGADAALQVGIVALTDSPAVDVEVVVSPLPFLLRGCKEAFPLKMPVVDRHNPFFLDLFLLGLSKERGDFEQVTSLHVSYSDLASNRYTYESQIDVLNSIAPVKIGSNANEKIAESLVSIERVLKDGFQQSPTGSVDQEIIKLLHSLETMLSRQLPQDEAPPLNSSDN